MLNKETLQKIQAGTDAEVYTTTTRTALWMAAGGYLAEANQVLSALWAYGLPHSRDVWLHDIAFMVLWEAAGNRPDLVPFPLQGIDAIEKNIRGRIAMDRWSYQMPDKPWTELTGQNLLRKAFLTADVFPSAGTEMEALAMLTKMMEEGFYSQEGLALGAELAARNGQPDLAIRFAKRCVGKTFSRPSPPNLRELAASRHVAPLLLQKSLAPELGLSDQIVREYVPELLKGLDNRITQGRSLVYGHLPWKELLRAISEAAIKADDYKRLDTEMRKKGWLGYRGASKKAISEAEKKLGVTLPADYKAFLAVSNGFGRASVTSGVPLPVAEIDYLKNVVDTFSFDSLLDFPQDEVEEEIYREKLQHAILITRYHDEQEVWLVPEDEGKTRWEVWFYAFWIPGYERYPSFRHYMEAELKQMEQLIKPR